MFKTTFANSVLTVLVVLGLASFADANQIYQRDSDFVIQYHACFSTSIGFDIIQNSMDTLFTEYIDRYNSDATSEIRKINTSKTAKLNDKVYHVARGEAIKLAVNSDSLDFSVDYTATSGAEKLSGQFKIGLDIQHPTDDNALKVPQLRLRLDKSDALAQLIFTFEQGEHFDQPSATRMLSGFIRTLNEYTTNSAASTFIALNGEAMNLNIILNCNSKEVDDLKVKTIGSDIVEFGMSNNVMNMVYPYAYDFRLNTLVNRIMMFNPGMHNLYEKYDLRQARGLLRLTKDAQLLDQFKQKENFSVPKISRVSADSTGKDQEADGDIMRFASSMFLEFQDYTNATLYDIAVAPMDIIWDIKAKISDREDGTQEFDAKFVKSKFKFKKCEMVWNAIVPNTEDKLAKASNPDDGDFDDEDDDEDSDQEAQSFKAIMGIEDDERKIRTSNYQNLACGAKAMIPQKMKQNKAKVQEMSQTMIDFIINGFKHLNDIPEGDSYQLQCSGLNLSRPKTRFESNRIVVSMKMKNNGNTIPDHLKAFCDKEDQELLRVDPRTFTFEQKQIIKDWLIYETHNQNFNYLFEIGKRSYVQNAKTFMDIMSPITQAVSSHEFLQDYCRVNHPKANTQRCALVYTQAKAWEEFNQVLNSTHLDILDPRNAYDPEDIDINADDYIMVQGQIFSNFEHLQMYHKNIQTDRFSEALKAHQDKQMKLYQFLSDEAVWEYNNVTTPFIDGLEDYCEDHTVSECKLRTKQIAAVVEDERLRKKTLQDIWDKEEAMRCHYDPCQEVGTDCHKVFDPKIRGYIADPKEAQAFTDKQEKEAVAAINQQKKEQEAREEADKLKHGGSSEKYVPKLKAEPTKEAEPAKPEPVKEEGHKEEL